MQRKECDSIVTTTATYNITGDGGVINSRYFTKTFTKFLVAPGFTSVCLYE